jgi:hypothetical protein
VGIPILRLLSWLRALFIFSMGGVLWAAPIQKLFVVPLAHAVWALLALMPFILLRFRWVFVTYVTIFIAALAVLAYDYFIPFRYISSAYTGEILNPSGAYSRRFSGDDVDYWISNFTVPNGDDLMMTLVIVAPLLLAIVYRNVYSYWTAKEAQSGPRE